MSTARVTNLQNEASSVVNLALDASGNVTIGNNLTVTGTTTQTGSTTFTAQTLFPDGSAAAPAISNTGDTNCGIYFPAADTIGFSTSGALALTLDPAGNLGLGVTPSAWYTGNSLHAIEITNATIWGFGTTVSNTGFGSNVYLKAGTAAYTYKIADYASLYEQSSSQHRWYIAPSGSAGDTISFTQAMTLTADGNLNIGASSGTGRLFVVVGNNATYQVAGNYTNNTNADFQIQIASNATLLTPSTATPLCFGTSNTERARIDSAGALLIGKQVNSVSTGGFACNGDGSCTASIASSNTYHVYNTSSPGYAFYVSSAGTVNAINTTINGISDRRLKENIRDLNGGLSNILRLLPRTFDWKDGKGKNIKNDRGWIADEFEQVYPDLIGEWADNAPEGEEPYKSVRADILPDVVLAIQELAAKVSALEAKQ